MQYDAIVVLGTGHIKRKYLPRLKKAASLFKSGKAKKIILTGGFWGGLKKAPTKSEAQTMATEASGMGLNKKDLILEIKSLNTIGNFYFTKKILVKNKFRKVLVITGKQHMPKSVYLAGMIWGSKIKYKFIDDNSKIRLATRGHSDVDVTKKMFAHVQPGDDKATKQIISGDPRYIYHYSRKLKQIL